MKKIIYTAWNIRSLDHNKFCRALLQYRNTASHKDGLSPAQKLYGHPVQDALPAHRRSFSQEWQRTAEVVKQQAHNNLQHHTTTNMFTPLLISPSNPMWLYIIPTLNFGIFMVSSQLYHPTRNITLKLPVSRCWWETVVSYVECPYQPVPHFKIHPPVSLLKNYATQQEPGNRLAVW